MAPIKDDYSEHRPDYDKLKRDALEVDEAKKRSLRTQFTYNIEPTPLSRIEEMERVAAASEAATSHRQAEGRINAREAIHETRSASLAALALN